MARPEVSKGTVYRCEGFGSLTLGVGRLCIQHHCNKDGNCEKLCHDAVHKFHLTKMDINTSDMSDALLGYNTFETENVVRHLGWYVRIFRLNNRCGLYLGSCFQGREKLCKFCRHGYCAREWRSILRPCINYIC